MVGPAVRTNGPYSTAGSGPSIQTTVPERRNGIDGSATAQANDSTKQNHDDTKEGSAHLSNSVESFEKVVPSEYKISQQIKPIHYTSDQLMHSKTVERDYAKNRTKSPERQRRQSDRSFDDQYRRYQSQPNIIIHDGNTRQEEKVRQQKNMESDIRSEKNACSTVVVNVNSGGGAELRRSRAIRQTDSKQITAPLRSEQQVHPLPPATNNIFSTGRRKLRLPRQLHSMSSSEDELPSTSHSNNEEMASRIDTEISSEKGFIYIKNAKIKNPLNNYLNVVAISFNIIVLQ
ncbi:unnamed protein product [Onchocerca ochengi]|uniref:Uncharacterized protein n=1 Tax=Onchocerca ochengi TaxID=42157 RepID=A0A182EJ51_ONCOC|nr:unnamed protein product [Onchocerca ochengi]